MGFQWGSALLMVAAPAIPPQFNLQMALLQLCAAAAAAWQEV